MHEGNARRDHGKRHEGVYETRSGGREISRTIIVEDILSTAGSLQPDVAHPADIDDDIKTRLTNRLPESEPLPDDGIPDLD